MSRVLVIIVLSFLLISCRDYNDKNMERHVNETEALRAEGIRMLNQADYGQAYTFGQKLLASSGGQSDAAALYGNLICGQASMFIDRGGTHFNVDSSYRYLHEAERIALKTANDSALASVYNGFGIYASNIEKDFTSSLNYFYQGLDAAERSGNDRLYSLLLANIAQIYSLNQDPSSLLYAKESYLRGCERNDLFLKYAGATTMAYSYAVSGKDTKKGLEYIAEAEKILNEDSIRDGSVLYYIYGKLLLQENRREEAKLCFSESMKSLRENGDEGDIRAFIEYADMLMEENRHDEALAALQEAYEITGRGHSVIFRQDLLKAYSDALARLGNTARAKELADIAVNEEAEARNARRDIMISHLKNKYDLERADNEMTRQQLEILQKQQTVNFLIFLIILTLILVAGAVYMYRKKNRLYRAIVIQFTETAREEKRLRQTIRTLEQQIADANKVQSPEAVEASGSEPKDEDDSENNATSEKMEQLAIAFENLISDPAVFSDNQISKDKIAHMLKTNRTYISRLVNMRYDMSFTQLVNSLRIKEAVRRLSDPDNDIPLKALSAELGYNSMTTFYSKFNEATGMTPAAFRAKARRII